jgi:DNA-binding NarL/FixJ family response regulator
VVTDSPRHIKVFVAEEQGFFLDAFKVLLSSAPTLEVVGASADTSASTLVSRLLAGRPDLLLFGIKTLNRGVGETLQEVGQKHPAIPVLLLLSSWEGSGLELLHRFVQKPRVGFGCLLKHQVDSTENLVGLIHNVAQGCVVIHPPLLEGLLAAKSHILGALQEIPVDRTRDGYNSFLRELSPREMEVLSWIAKGYRNNIIAEVLCLNTNTVEKHINSIYSKLNADELKHPRIYAALAYLEDTGRLRSTDRATKESQQQALKRV